MTTQSKTALLTRWFGERLPATSPKPVATKAQRAIPYNLISWLVPLLLLLLWESAVRFGLIPPRILPAPSTVLKTAWDFISTGELPRHLAVSLRRAWTGYLIGGSVALTLGFATGLFPLAAAIIDRPLQMVRTVPFLALVPMVIVWFGVGETAKIFLIALGCTFSIYINTVSGIRQVDPRLLELGRIYGASPSELIRKIILPGALPSILIGLRYAMGTSWLALIVAETLAAQAGLGFMAMDAREFLRTDVIVLTIIIYSVIGVLVDLLFRWLDRRLLAWHPNYAKRTR
ncbi:MAG: ABC transporter permease subunit [Caldilineaceae bacterium]|nr:ABC transporter permease subunit [Caldilineaceae bacterium]